MGEAKNRQRAEKSPQLTKERWWPQFREAVDERANGTAARERGPKTQKETEVPQPGGGGPSEGTAQHKNVFERTPGQIQDDDSSRNSQSQGAAYGNSQREKHRKHSGASCHECHGQAYKHGVMDVLGTITNNTSIGSRSDQIVNCSVDLDAERDPDRILTVSRFESSIEVYA